MQHEICSYYPMTAVIVLRCYMFHHREGLPLNRTNYENVKMVLKKIIPFYHKGNIPIITEKKLVKKNSSVSEEYKTSGTSRGPSIISICTGKDQGNWNKTTKKHLKFGYKMQKP